MRRGPWDTPREVGVARKACSTEAISRARLQANLESQFKMLARQWKRETALLGQISKIIMHPAYQRIMAMGPDVIPLILKEMSREPGHWFWALHNLVPAGQDPAEGATNTSDAASAWLEWGKKEGII
jgi:hypothetical protein